MIEETPVFTVVASDSGSARQTIGSVKQEKARDASVVAGTDGVFDIKQYAGHILEIPHTSERMASMLTNVQLQLVVYHMANHLGQ